jgi:hypothetical protein
VANSSVRATNNSFGLVQPDGVTITSVDGVISAAAQYSLPTASKTVLGGVMIDDDTIKINQGTISANYADFVKWV